jgi:hypothetical protein
VADDLSSNAKAAAEAAEKAVRAREALPAKPLTLAEAIAARNIGAIVGAGGTAQDVAKAIAAGGVKVGETPLLTETAAYVQSQDGRTGISIRSAGGVMFLLFSSDFDTYIPPNGFGSLPFNQDNAARTAGLTFTPVPVVDRAQSLQAAIAAADIGRIIVYGGNAADVARAMSVQGIQGGGAPLVPESAQFFSGFSGGFGVQVSSTSGAQVNLHGGQLSGYTPANGPLMPDRNLTIILPKPAEPNPAAVPD